MARIRTSSNTKLEHHRVSGFYYPRQERVGLGENCVKWAAQLLNDGVSNVFEEFWPDINRKFLHER